MAVGIIIHITVGKEKRTEFFSQENLRIGSGETSDLQIHTERVSGDGVWLDLDNTDGFYRVTNFDKSLNFTLNGNPLRRYVAISDGDVLQLGDSDISFSFFSLTSQSSLITTNREQPHIAQFIEEAALESAYSPKRDDAKAFLREFVRELSREINWTTKLIVLVLAIGFITGVLYLGYAVNASFAKTGDRPRLKTTSSEKLEEKLGETSNQIGELDKTNKDIIKSVSLAPNLRVEYGNGVCLILGVYDLVDRKNGKTLRYRDPQSYQASPYEPAPRGLRPAGKPSAGGAHHRRERFAGRVRFYRHRFSRRRRLYRHKPARGSAVGRKRPGQNDDAAVQWAGADQAARHLFPEFSAALSR